MSKLKNHCIQAANRLVSVALGQEATNNMYRRLAKGAAGTFGQKMANMVLMLLTNILLARLVGLEEYGIYSYVQSWIALLVLPAVCGMDQLMVRHVAAYRAQAAWGLLSGLLRRTNQITLTFSLGLAILAAGISWALFTYWDVGWGKILTFLIALFLLPLTVLVQLRQAAMRGLNHVVSGQLPEQIFQPLLFILLLSGTFFLGHDTPSASTAMGVKVVSFSLIFLVGARMLLRALPRQVYDASPDFHTSSWLKSALPLLFASGLHVVNTQAGVLMLGSMAGTNEVGILVVAKRMAGFIVFFLGALNIALAPTIARLYAQGDMNELQQVVTKGARITFCLAAPLALAMIAFGNWFLLPFGHAFTEGQVALAIFAIGGLINVATGPVGTLLIMTGHERDNAVTVGASVLLGIVLNAILIPQWGLNGAAVAGSFSVILWNILLVVCVHRRLGIHPTALGNWWSRSSQKAAGLSSP